MKAADSGRTIDAMPLTATPGVHEFMTAAPDKPFSRSRVIAIPEGKVPDEADEPQRVVISFCLLRSRRARAL